MWKETFIQKSGCDIAAQPSWVKFKSRSEPAEHRTHHRRGCASLICLRFRLFRRQTLLDCTLIRLTVGTSTLNHARKCSKTVDRRCFVGSRRETGDFSENSRHFLSSSHARQTCSRAKQQVGRLRQGIRGQIATGNSVIGSPNSRFDKSRIGITTHCLVDELLTISRRLVLTQEVGIFSCSLQCVTGKSCKRDVSDRLKRIQDAQAGVYDGITIAIVLTSADCTQVVDQRTVGNRSCIQRFLSGDRSSIIGLVCHMPS